MSNRVAPISPHGEESPSVPNALPGLRAAPGVGGPGAGAVEDAGGPGGSGCCGSAVASLSTEAVAMTTVRPKVGAGKVRRRSSSSTTNRFLSTIPLDESSKGSVHAKDGCGGTQAGTQAGTRTQLAAMLPLPSASYNYDGTRRRKSQTASDAAGTQEDRSKYGGTKLRDGRTTSEKLTDYLLALANPSVEQRKKQPQLTVFEEGEGGRVGCRQGYWQQHYVRERNVAVAVEGATGDRKDESYRKDLDVWRTPDNEVFCCHNPNLAEFYHLGGYRNFPDVIGVEMLVRELTMIDASTSSFHVSFTIGLRWYDPVFDTQQFWNKTDEKVFARSIPYVTLQGHDRSNQSNLGVPLDGDHPSLSEIDRHCGMVVLRKDGNDPPGVLYRKIMIEATFKKAMHLGDFPFDKQHLLMNLELYGANDRQDDDYGRVLLPINVDMSLDTPHDEWYVFVADAVSTRQRGEKQRLEVTINVRRRPVYFILNVVSVIAMLTTLSFNAYSQENTWEWYGDRCQITLTLMLTSVAYKFFIADQIPKVAYLTVLDWYIYLGIVTTSLILVMNTLVLCETEAECNSIIAETMEDARRIEQISKWWIVAMWGAGNLVMAAKIATFAWALCYRDLDLRQYAKDGEDIAIEKQRLNEAVQIQRRRAKSTWFRDDEDSLAKRRKRALEKLFEMEQAQHALVSELTTVQDKLTEKSVLHGGVSVFSHLASHRRQLENKRMLNIPIGKAKRMLKPVKKDANASGNADSALVELFRRAGMLAWVPTLGPLLGMAELSTAALHTIYNNGNGVSALLSLLEEAGVCELPQRVQLVNALATSDSADDHVSQTTALLALQGSASYIWLDATTSTVPLTRAAFLECVAKRTGVLIEEHPSIKGDKAARTKALKNLANCAMADVMLRTKLGASVEHVYAARELKSCAGYPLYTQVWVGYLLNKRATDALPAANHAISMDIGTGKIAVGFAVPIKDACPIECNLLKTGSGIIDATELTQLLFKAVKCQVNPENADVDEGATVMMQQICSTVIKLLTQVFEVAEKENEGIFAQRAEDGEQHNLSIFLFGTSMLRSWQEGLEKDYGTRPLELMEAIGEWCTRALNDATTCLSPNVAVIVAFEVISGDHEARCEHVAFQHALEFYEKRDWPAAAKADKSIEGLGNMAWGSGSCQGIITDHLYAIETGLNAIVGKFEQALNEEKKSIGQAYPAVVAQLQAEVSQENPLLSHADEDEEGGAPASTPAASATVSEPRASLAQFPAEIAA